MKNIPEVLYVTKAKFSADREKEILKYLIDTYGLFKKIEINVGKEFILHYSQKSERKSYDEIINELKEKKIEEILEESYNLNGLDIDGNEIRRNEIDYNGDPFTYDGYEFNDNENKRY